jgi:hypothetical protein
MRIANLAVFAVLRFALWAQQKANTSSPETSPQGDQRTTSTPTTRATKSIKYRNTKYGFTFSLPTTWKGYSAVEGSWDGHDNNGPHGDEVVERGPEITLVNPHSTPTKPYQDIYIMVFSHAQWDSLQQGKFVVSAAPVGPGELGRNRKYVFAEPPRMINDNAYGWEEVVKIMHSHPLHAF